MRLGDGRREVLKVTLQEFARAAPKPQRMSRPLRYAWQLREEKQAGNAQCAVLVEFQSEVGSFESLAFVCQSLSGGIPVRRPGGA